MTNLKINLFDIWFPVKEIEVLHTKYRTGLLEGHKQEGVAGYLHLEATFPKQMQEKLLAWFFDPTLVPEFQGRYTHTDNTERYLTFKGTQVAEINGLNNGVQRVSKVIFLISFDLTQDNNGKVQCIAYKRSL